jgi:RHS repeat-associated protein
MKCNLARTVCFSLFISFFLINGCVEPVNKKKAISEKSDFFKLFKKNNKGLGKNSHDLSWSYEYTDNSLLSKIIGPGGKATEFRYEFYSEKSSKIRQIEKKTGDGSVTWLFDETGNLTNMEDKLGQVKYEYDESNRLIKFSRANIPSLSYTYNSNDQLTFLTLSNGFRIEYIYDFLGRLSVMKTPAGEFTYNYFMGEGIIERNYPNGVRSQYKFSPNGNLESITYADKTNKVIAKYSYIYNANTLISSINEWTTQGERKLSYDYDQVQRLTGFVDADGKKTNYSYDEFGNRTEVTDNNSKTESYTYDGLGRMLTFNNLKCEYDNSGNLLTDNNGEKSFDYNSGNQLIKAANTSYEYDGDGLLISRDNSNQKTTFVNNSLTDIWQPILALEDDGKQTFYIWEGNTPVAKIVNGETTYFLTDHLSSVREIVNEKGNVSKQINYSPFGIPDQTSSTDIFIPGFTGLFFEPEANIYLTKARAYNPNSGRFLQIDPLHQTPSGSQKNLSVFTYCGGDPINFQDQIGTQTDWSEVKYNLKSDYHYYFNTPVRNEIVNQIIDNAMRLNSNNIIDAARQIVNWRNDNRNKYSQNFTEPSSEEWQVADDYMFARTNPIISLGAPYWSIIHYFGERSNGLIKPTLFSSEKSNWQRQTWKTNLYIAKGILDNFTQQSSFFKQNKSQSSNTLWHGATFHSTSLRATQEDIAKYKTEGRYQYAQENSEKPFLTSPSNVGGIYLAGAGKTFEGLGSLSGIAVDESTGKLVLISEDKGGINLPPLRMDDVVTVFRSVYQHGEAPFVSIDPNPKDPHGPVMNTRHGAATDSTYVGWVLFEADRIMKAYSLGEDNITKKPVESKVPGYKQVLDVQFSADPGGVNWERFWIVPSSVERNVSSDQALTLFDVPLMVKTQKMILKNGKLETAPGGKSSKGAEVFSKWFTENYDRISDESFSLPPAESGITKPVPVFKELQRIALITAIAEQLRDRGVALPFWMRGYEIKSFPTPGTTPSHTVTRNNGNSILTVFGGVNLSPSTDKIITKMSSPIANTIAPKISAFVNNRTYLEPVALSVDNKKFNAVVMPGNATKDLGPCALNETDLLVPVTRNFDLGLTRKFNSFITPLDNLFGRTWSLDLPFLEEQKIPAYNNGARVAYKISYNLISPMNSYSEKIEKVYVGDNKLIGFKTTMIASEDGTNMYFNDKGFLVAYEQNPEMILYNRDQNNRITQIVGFFAEKPLADIKLEYNKDKVISATGSNGESVKYIYSVEGDLKEVVHSKGGSVGQSEGTKDVVSYEYKNIQVIGLKYNDETASQFQYNEKGQLVSSKSSGNPQVEYSISSNEAGSVVTTYETPETRKEKKSFLSYFKVKKEGGKENPLKKVTGTMQYDYVLRPVKQIAEDGTLIAWDYSGSDYEQMEVVQSTGDKYIIKQSKDGSNIHYSLPDCMNFDENYNKAGQLLAFSQNNKPVFTQEWNSFGKPEKLRFENSTINNEYDNKAVLQRTLITPPGNSKTFQKWMEYQYNETGQVANVSDFSGLKTTYTYDQSGEVSSINSKQGSIFIKRSKELIDEIETSWGTKTNYTYDRDGNILSVINSGSGNSSFMKFNKGRITEISGTDGTEYSISYNPDPDGYQIKEIKSPVNDLKYNYNIDGNLINVLCNSKYEIEYSYDKVGRIKQVLINSRK